MPGMLNGKILLVTGGGGGIGRAAGLLMAREGASLAVADSDRARAEETAAAVAAAGGTAIALAADVTDEAQVAAMVEAAIARYGRLDGAFNNAGINHAGSGIAGKRTHEVPRDAAEKIIAVNLTGVFLCMKRELGPMLAQGGGAICNTASIAGMVGMAATSAYVAAKHGVVGLTKTAALEYAGEGIRVNCICPGFTDTPMIRASLDRRGAEIARSVPMGRVAQANEIAELATWLLSDRASYVTGGVYPVDGGFTAA